MFFGVNLIGMMIMLFDQTGSEKSQIGAKLEIRLSQQATNFRNYEHPQ